MRHLTPRSPRKKGRFCWSRGTTAHGRVVYRLFRRDETGRIYVRWHDLDYAYPRIDLARLLRRSRKELLDRVDEIDLANLGVTQ